MERIEDHKNLGAYLTIGISCQRVIENAGRQAELASVCQDCLSEQDADRAGDFPTVIRRLSQDEFELLFRNGFEVTDLTLAAYYPDRFQHIPYSALH